MHWILLLLSFQQYCHQTKQISLSSKSEGSQFGHEKCFVWQIYVDSAQAGDSALIDTHVWGFGRLWPQCENPCRQRWERKKTTPSSSSYVSSSSYFFLFLIHYVCFLNPHLLAKTFTSSSCFAKMPSSAVGSDLAFDILSEMWMKPTKSPLLLQMDLGRYNQISKFKWQKWFFTNTQMKWSREDSLDPSFKLRNEHEKFFTFNFKFNSDADDQDNGTKTPSYHTYFFLVGICAFSSWIVGSHPSSDIEAQTGGALSYHTEPIFSEYNPSLGGGNCSHQNMQSIHPYYPTILS